MANKQSLVVTALVLGLPIVIALIVFGPAAFDLLFHRRPPERYLIPAGFTGWTRVQFRQKSAPSLPIEAGHRLIKLDGHGQAFTSSDPQSGHGNDDFYYYSVNDPGVVARTHLSDAGVCKGGMIWQVETMVDEPTSTPFTRFFVGTEAQYRREVDPRGENLPSCE